MRFDRYSFWKHSEMFVVLPTIVVIVNEPYYERNSFQIYVRWLFWSMRWRWFESGDTDDGANGRR